MEEMLYGFKIRKIDLTDSYGFLQNLYGFYTEIKISHFLFNLQHK